MEIVKGFEGAHDPSDVCKLNQILYDLKQTLRTWHLRIDSWFLEHGLTKSNVNFSMYYRDKNAQKTHHTLICR